jgi:hypothetical protein
MPNTVAYPIVYLTMPDWVVDAVSAACCCRECLIANEEVQVFGTALPRQVSAGPSTAGQEGGLVRDCRASRTRAAATACRAFGSYCSGEDEGGGVVAGETWGCIVTTKQASYSYLHAYQVSSSPCRCKPVSVLNRNVGARRQLGAYLSMTTAGVWDAIFAAARGDS